MPPTWDKLDTIMRPYSPRLREDLELTPDASNRLATTIAAEARALAPATRRALRDQDRVGLRRRLEELVAFERFMDLAARIQSQSGVLAPLTRAQVAYQLYTVFVYLGESCFSRLRDLAPPDSVLARCCRYLTEGHVRGLRSAVAEANWRYNDDFTGLTYIYFRDAGRTEEVSYTVSQLEMDFWDKLARVTAYAAFQTIQEEA